MSKYVAALVLVFSLVLMVAWANTALAQEPTETPEAPTATPVPPTATPVPPTATPVPPTATPVPPTATPVPPTATPVPPTATPVPPTSTPVPEPQPCIIRNGLQIRLQNVRDTITADQDGHVELSFRNPLVNDCTVQTEMRIVTPDNILVFGKDGIVSGGAGTLNAIATVPPGAERVAIMDFKGLETGEGLIVYSGTYWPEGNKDANQAITAQQSMTVLVPTDPKRLNDTPQLIEPEPAATTTPPPASVDPRDPPSGSNQTDSTGLLGSLAPLWLIVLIVLVVLVVLVALVAMVSMGRRGGGTTVIRE